MIGHAGIRARHIRCSNVTADRRTAAHKERAHGLMLELMSCADTRAQQERSRTAAIVWLQRLRLRPLLQPDKVPLGSSERFHKVARRRAGSRGT
jgi:hypothetical protein